MMATFLTIVGGITIVLLLVVVAMLCAATAFDAVTKLYDRLMNSAADRVRIEMCSNWSGAANWFSEDESTYLLLKDIAVRIGSHRFDVGEIRQTWREHKARKEQKTCNQQKN